MRVFLILLLAVAASASYPSSYPFENEYLDLPANLPDTLPNFKYDGSDPGGYVYAGSLHNLTKYEQDILQGRHSFGNGPTFFFYLVSLGLPFDIDVYNCTAAGLGGLTLGSGYMTSTTLLGQKACEPSNCCQDIAGSAVGMPLFEDSLSAMLTTWNDQWENNLCGSATEAFFCGFLFRRQVFCKENLLTTTERLLVSPCYDTFVHFYRSCVIMSQAGHSDLGFDPEDYYAKLSPEQTMSYVGVAYIPDKVCRPYSYFYPAEDSETDDEDSETDDEASQTGEEGAIGVLGIALVLL